jgi:hypothetical protein
MMQKIVLLILGSFLFASSVHAVPLMWTLSGTTSMTVPSEYNVCQPKSGLRVQNLLGYRWNGIRPEHSNLTT